MDIEIIAVNHAASAEDEFVWLQATKELNLKQYAVMDVVTDQSGETAANGNFYRFGNHPVQEGDYIVLFTGRPAQVPASLPHGNYHHFYWAQARPIWSDAASQPSVQVQVRSIGKTFCPTHCDLML